MAINGGGMRRGNLSRDVKELTGMSRGRPHTFPERMKERALKIQEKENQEPEKTNILDQSITEKPKIDIAQKIIAEHKKQGTGAVEKLKAKQANTSKDLQH